MVVTGPPPRVGRAIYYRPLPAQLRFHESTAKIKGFCGPVGSGKSAALAQEAFRLSVENRGLDGFLGSPTYRMLEDSTKEHLLELLDVNGVPHEHRRADNTIVITLLGSRILCRSLEEPDRLRGPNLAWICVDELTFCASESFLRYLLDCDIRRRSDCVLRLHSPRVGLISTTTHSLGARRQMRLI